MTHKALWLAFLVGLCSASATSPNSTDCRVRAWVRAEDLAPSTTSHGDLRIKVSGPLHDCSTQVASVDLRLALDEFAEVKYQRGTLPKITKAENQTRPSDDLDMFGSWMSNDEPEILYDYSAYDAAMHDPEIWGIKAETRRAWTTETTLFGSGLNFSDPLVTSFVVVSPAVNYPPAFINFRSNYHGQSPIRRHADMSIAYIYTAVVTFTDGRIVDVPAGRTNFRTAFERPAPATIQEPVQMTVPFEDQSHYTSAELELPHNRKWTETEERCLPKANRTTFVADVTLEDGGVYRIGQRLNGKITVRPTSTNGSTSMSQLSVSLVSRDNVRWAAELASSNGDPTFASVMYESRTTPHYGARRAPSSEGYDHLFQVSANNNVWSWSPGLYLGQNQHITPHQPTLTFSFSIPPDFVPSFSSYHGSIDAELSIQLTASYGRDAAQCIQGKHFHAATFDDAEDDSSLNADEAKALEDGLWDMNTRVGQARQVYHGRSIRLLTRVPVRVLGEIPSPEQRVPHYLDANGPSESPTIMASTTTGATLPGSVARPLLTEEAYENTTARLMDPDASFDPSHTRLMFHRRMPAKLEALPDPAAAYYDHGHAYAGLLWKKKQVALERGVVAQESNTQEILST
uniref:Arrestin-like N-terminal domain-containing protein n=1 Tax=Mycena chlorophos TaxID=658473 RepID=A0ABQ0L4X2_MYCCL|nr:predicted protein [Mycena chlorophos]